MKYLFCRFLVCSFIFLPPAAGQGHLFTKSGSISFESTAPLENIKAVNNRALAVWELNTGKIEFSLLMKGFEFEKALMQEHFNENYVESDKYPKATFKGIVENSSSVLLSKDNSYSLTVSGALTIHGVTRPLTLLAKVFVKNGKVSSVANFSILLQDYNIKIPAIVADNINKKVDVTVTVSAFQPMT